MTNNIENRARIAVTAKAFLAGLMGPVEMVRTIAKLAAGLDEHNDPLLVSIRGFESEAEIFPIGDLRAQYEIAYLISLDSDLIRYFGENQQILISACEGLVARYETEVFKVSGSKPS